jgi:hypothetical protein
MAIWQFYTYGKDKEILKITRRRGKVKILGRYPYIGAVLPYQTFAIS